MNLPRSQPTLRFPGHEHPDLPLRPGTNGLCRDPDHDRGLMITPGGRASLVEFSNDARGLWLHVGEDARGVHVNGRPVKHLAALRAGDRIHVEAIEIMLGDAEARAAEVLSVDQTVTPLPGLAVLRGLCGDDHGRAIELDDAAMLPLRQAKLRCAHEGVWLEASDYDGCRVNGQPARQVRLQPGDQIEFGPALRYALESPPWLEPAAGLPPTQRPDFNDAPARKTRNIPWLLIAACVMAAVLLALLWFGVH